MTNEQLIKTVQRLLKTDQDLDFLLRLDLHELERLVVLVRDRLDNATWTSLSQV
jgi:hypothetical protein